MEPGAPSAMPTGTSTTLKSYAVCLATKTSKLCGLAAICRHIPA